MGHRKRSQDLETLHGEKDEDTSALRTKLDICTAHISLLQARLNSTLDAMDAMRSAHLSDLSIERKAKERLKAKLDQFIEFSKSVEEERDELRDAVLYLADKESTVSDSEEAFRQGANVLGTGSGFAPLIVTTLRAELEKERTSHIRTHDQAESKILALRAQLARREAELEACVIRAELLPNLKDKSMASVKAAVGSVTPKRTLSSTRNTKHPPIQEDPTKILGLTATRHKALEVEVDSLAQQLRDAWESPRRRLVNTGVQTEYLLTARPCSKNKHKHKLTLGSTQPQNMLGKPSSVDGVRPRDSLDAQVRQLGLEINAFRTQREALQSIFEGTPKAGAFPVAIAEDYEPQAVIREIQTELDRTKRSAAQREEVLENEIAHLRQLLSSQRQRSISPVDPPTGALIALEGTVSQPSIKLNTLLDEEDGEQTMDLGTPLQPQLVLSDGETITMVNSVIPPPMKAQNSDIDNLGSETTSPQIPTPIPCFISQGKPLEPSPGYTGKRGMLSEQAMGRIEMLERELQAARGAVAQKDQEMVDLRHAVHELRVQIREATSVLVPEDDEEEEVDKGSDVTDDGVFLAQP